MKRHFRLIFYRVFWIAANCGHKDELLCESDAKQQANKIVPDSLCVSSLGIIGNVPIGYYTRVPDSNYSYL